MKLSEINKKNLLVKSAMSKCYLLEDGSVLKLFDNKRTIDEIERFKYFLWYQNDSFVFPYEFIYDSKYFYGYIASFANGIPLENIFSTSNLLELALDSIKLEKDLEHISSGGITLYDFHEGNLLYDGKNYKAIDFDEAVINSNKMYSKRHNEEAHRILIHNLFLDNLERNKYTKYILDKLADYKSMCMKPSDLIFKIKRDMDKYYGEDIDTVSKVKSIIRR